MLYFDIGANVGKWATANINTADTIICVEASPTTYNQLINATKTNTKIKSLNVAICDNSGQDITFYDCTTASTISTLNKDWLTDSSSRFCNYPYREIKCKTMTIDSLIETYGIPDIIKVDVEGGEFSCLSSLTQMVPLLCFEWASELNTVTFECLHHLTKLGFTQFLFKWGMNIHFDLLHLCL
jgi:FkbM family methyltransferase